MPEDRPAQTTATFAALTEWLDERLKATGVPGAALGVVVGERLLTHAFGVEEVGSAARVAPATTFRVASLTKVFTAAALAQQARAGRLEIRQPVRDVLPGFAVADARTAAAVTTADLLAHSAGWADAIDPDMDEPLDHYVDRMRDLVQVAPVGRHLSYSNSGYALAGHLLATLSGLDYEKVIRAEVLDPLRLASTGFPVEDPGHTPQARGHAVGDDGPVLVEADGPPRAANPAFGLVSSVDDLLTFLQAQLGAGRDLSPFAGMLAPLGPGGSVGPTVVDHVGMGWMLRDVGPHSIAMAQGSDAGYCAGMAFAAADGFAVAVLTNSDAALMLVNDTLWQAVELFLGATVATPRVVALDPADLETVSGTFALWDGMVFEVRAEDGGLGISTTVAGQGLTDLSGPLSMTDRDRGFLPALGGRVWFDFVPADHRPGDHRPGDHGPVDWLRFAGRLAPRVG